MNVRRSLLKERIITRVFEVKLPSTPDDVDAEGRR
jgi:hypothetical protein